jgi:hypothetical protein
VANLKFSIRRYTIAYEAKILQYSSKIYAKSHLAIGKNKDGALNLD